MTRAVSTRPLFNDHPFDAEGVSVYAGTGATIQYRNRRTIPDRCRYLKGQGGEFDVAAASVLKTNRIASSTDLAEQSFLIPTGFASSTMQVDIRHWKDDVENETSQYRTQSFDLDASRDLTQSINGTGTLVGVVAKAGGVCLVRFAYNEALDGTTPAKFRLTATAGPTSPADVTINYRARQRFYEFTTPALSDASAYTYKITAENTGATVTKDLLTGISVTADASGPPAATNASAETI